MVNAPYISVITAVRNRADTLPRCLASVAEQDYPVEHIVIDGASTDGTVGVIRRHSPAVWVSEPDRGVFDAWNKGIELARGEWIAFLGADDAYLPDAVRRYVEAARANSSAEYISSRIEVVRADGGTRVVGQAWRWPAFRRHMCVAHPGSWHRASLFRRLGSYDLAYPIAGDYELLLRAGPQLRAAFLDAVTARMDAGGQSDSAATLVETLRAKLRHRARSRTAAALDHAIALMKFRCRGAAQALGR